MHAYYYGHHLQVYVVYHIASSHQHDEREVIMCNIIGFRPCVIIHSYFVHLIIYDILMWSLIDNVP